MPKLGLKCFAGSFVLSLAAVVAATKAYSVLAPKTMQPEIYYGIIEARNIELFTHTEESDPIAEKFNRLTATATEEQIHKVQQVVAAVERENIADDVLYAPQDDAAPLYAPEAETVMAAVPVELQASDTVTAMAEISTGEQMNASIEPEDTTLAEDLQIADASLAPQFMIPLKHNFSTEKMTVAVSSRAATNQVASTGNVNINNLGTDNKVAQTSEQVAPTPAATAPQSLTESLAAAQQMPATETVASLDDDPWEVAEVANKNITRNANAEQPADKAVTGGNKVPYKMQENLLIPIPEDIRKEKNLTPQISSSAENKKLEEELRRKHQQEAGIEPSAEDIEINSGTVAPASGTSTAPSATSATTTESEEISDAESRSLSDSIAAWFSNTGKKTAKPASETPSNTGDKSSSNTQDNNTSLFRRLLGLSATNKDSNIAPTELKLAFQPNRAEISGQTLEWIRAFAENAVNYENTGIEVRIDRGGSYELQQKRLKLLYRLLTNHGVEYQKINIIFTDREPNSFIIRNVRYVPIEEKAKVAARKTGPWY